MGEYESIPKAIDEDGNCIYFDLSNVVFDQSIVNLQSSPSRNMEDMGRGNVRRHSSPQRGPEVSGICILNMNPGEAPRSQLIRAIRSHAAQAGHNRKRVTRQTQLEVHEYRSMSQVNKDKSSSAMDTLVVDRSRLEKLKKKKYQAHSHPVGLLSITPGPQTPVASYRRDPFQSYARAVTDKEICLIDHYVTCVVDRGYVNCGVRRAHEQSFMERVRSCWVPWSLNNRGLLAGILMAACRSLMSLQPESGPYALCLLKYKTECIRMAQIAISRTEHCTSDQTIALALVLAAEEFMSGNIMEYQLHSAGIIKIVNIRGGIDNLKNGFIEHLLLSSIYNPIFKR